MRHALVLAALIAAPVYANSELLGAMDDETVAPVLADLAEAIKNNHPTTILINSPGGQVWAGLTLVDALAEASRAGIVTTCVVDREAASMAAVVLQMCSRRLVKAGSFVLFHNAATSVKHATSRELRQIADDLDAVSHRLAITASWRLNITLTEYEKRVNGKDWYLSPAEAVAIGAADGVLP